jgi:transposase-like protein
MTDTCEFPETLQQAIQFFSDYENCHKFMVELRWPDGAVKCPRCGSSNVTYLQNARVWKCYENHERQKFSLKVGTIFEESPIGLEKWLAAVWMIVNCKNGVSSYEINRALGVTQKTAWFMAHRIRLALHSGGFEMLSGEVEVDESFIGGKSRNMHLSKRKKTITGTGGKDKMAVMGMVERGGDVRTVVVPNRRKKELQKHIHEHVKAGSVLFTDQLLSYHGLEANYVHKVIDHAVEYVQGNIHTNTMENFWSLLKRGLRGTYVSVEPFHLFRYLDEQTFRYNSRKDEDGDMGRFIAAMNGVTDKRLTYKVLTGKQECQSTN